MKSPETLEVIEDTDARTSDQQLLDIKEAIQLRQSAERFERRGQVVTAVMFRNAAWELEQGKQWLSRKRN